MKFFLRSLLSPANILTRAFSTPATSERTKLVLLKYEQIFASRKDLLEFLGDVDPRSLDAILSKMLYPCGKWVVEVSEKDSLELIKRARYDPYGRLSAQNINFKDLNNLQRAKSFKIYDNVLRLRSTGEVTKSDVHYIFEDLGVTRDTIRRIYVAEDRYPDYLITFRSFSDALNAHKQKDGLYVNGHSINLTLYDI